MAKLVYKTKWMIAQYEKADREHRQLGLSEETLTIVREKEWKKLWAREIEDARAKAYLKAIQDAEAAVIRQRVQAGDYEGMPELQEIMSKLKHKRGNGGSLHLHYFVTVNCKPDVQLAELKKKVQKYVRRKMVRKVEYVYEQRGAHEGEMGKGMHCHMLVTQRGDMFDGVFKTNTRNTFKTLVGNVDTHVDMRPVAEKFLEDKRSYMRGIKTQDGKAEKVAMDRVWRKTNNLEDYYIQDNGCDQAEGHLAPDASSEETDVSTEDDGGSSVCSQVC